MTLNSELQFEILRALATVYPSRVDTSEIAELSSQPDFDRNLYYLYESGLVDAISANSMDNPNAILGPKITTEGLDYLESTEEDKAITIRFDEDQLRQILLSQLETAQIPPEERSVLEEAVRSSTVDQLKKLLSHLVSTAMNHWHDVLRFFQGP